MNRGLSDDHHRRSTHHPTRRIATPSQGFPAGKCHVAPIASSDRGSVVLARVHVVPRTEAFFMARMLVISSRLRDPIGGFDTSMLFIVPCTRVGRPRAQSWVRGRRFALFSHAQQT